MLAPSPADAYCRKTTKSPPGSSYNPAETGVCGDANGALPIYWPQACVEYRVIVEPQLVARGALTAERARAIVANAVNAWVQAPCGRKSGGTRSPSIRLVDVDDARCQGGPTGAAADTHNEVRFSAFASPESAGPGTLAVTNNAFGPSTGAATEAQLSVYDTGVYASLSNNATAIDSYLAPIVRHELGHFLGLAHSERMSAIMYAYYNPNAAPGLTDDDAAAICNAYDPDGPLGSGCSVAANEDPARAQFAFPVFLVFVGFGSLTGRALRRRAGTYRRARTRCP